MRRWVVLGLIGLGILFATMPMAAETRVFFTSQGSVESEIVKLIEHTHFTIDLALYEFNSRPLAEALARARARGVVIRAILNGRNSSASPAPEIAFDPREVRSLEGKPNSGRGIMHHKFALFDQEHVVTGSYNWTAGAEHANYENAIFIDEPSAIASFHREFETLWQRASAFESWGARPMFWPSQSTDRTFHLPWFYRFRSTWRIPNRRIRRHYRQRW